MKETREIGQSNEYVSRLIESIRQEYSVGYEQIAAVAGVSVPQLFRIRRGTAGPIGDNHLVDLCAHYNRELIPALWASILDRVTPERAEICQEALKRTLAKRGFDSKITTMDTGARGRVFTAIDIQANHYEKLSTHSAAGVIDHLESNCPSGYPEEIDLPHTLDQFYYRTERRLYDRGRMETLAPRGAILQVDATRRSQIEDGTLVLAKVRMAGAGVYRYSRQSTSEGKAEVYESCFDNTTSVKHYRYGIDESLDRQRLILGQVTRIVHYSIL